MIQHAKTVDEALAMFAAARNRGGAGFVVLADAGGDIAMAECIPAACAVFRPDADWFAQANHARTHEMVAHDRGRTPDSFRRLSAMEAAVAPRVGTIAPSAAALILRDRSSSAYANDSIVANLRVLNTVVVHPRSRTLWHATSMQPLAPFGELVPFSLGTSTAAALPADPELDGPLAHQAAVIAELREAGLLTEAGRLFEAQRILDGVAARHEPFIEPFRLAWSRARVRLARGEPGSARALLDTLDTDAAPLEVRAYGLLARALAHDQLGHRDMAVDCYRRAQALLEAHPEFEAALAFDALRTGVRAGLASPQAVTTVGELPDLSMVPR